MASKTVREHPRKAASDCKEQPTAVLSARDGALLVKLIEEMASAAAIAATWAAQLVAERSRDGHSPGIEESLCAETMKTCESVTADIRRVRLLVGSGSTRIPIEGAKLVLLDVVTDIRHRLALAQTALNQAMFPDLRPGRKLGTTSAPAYQGYIATAVRRLDGKGPQIKQLDRWLENEAKLHAASRLTVNGIRLERIDRQPDTELLTIYFFKLFALRDGKLTSQTRPVTRRQMEDRLRQVRLARQEESAREVASAKRRSGV
jgi:hypothetical protein